LPRLGIERLVPYALTKRAAFGAQRRMQETIVRASRQMQRRTLGAQTTETRRVIRVAPNTKDFVVRCVDQHSAVTTG
jgi:hypothetical protein